MKVRTPITNSEENLSAALIRKLDPYLPNRVSVFRPLIYQPTIRSIYRHPIRPMCGPSARNTKLPKWQRIAVHSSHLPTYHLSIA